MVVSIKGAKYLHQLIDRTYDDLPTDTRNVIIQPLEELDRHEPQASKISDQSATKKCWRIVCLDEAPHN